MTHQTPNPADALVITDGHLFDGSKTPSEPRSLYDLGGHDHLLATNGKDVPENELYAISTE